jgi:hypothetical protein
MMGMGMGLVGVQEDVPKRAEEERMEEERGVYIGGEREGNDHAWGEPLYT